MAKSAVLLIYTGGTIGMRPDHMGTLVPFDFNKGIYEEFPALRSQNIDIGVFPFEPPIDSSNASNALSILLAEIIRDNYDSFDGFVVLHGTDTMSYTSSLLSFMLDNLSKPVVFTGSQIPIGSMRSDGRENLITAIEIAAAKEKDAAVVPEVSLYFQNKLFRANRTKKLSAEDLNAFVSYNYPALASVGIGIHYNHAAIMKPRHNKPFSVNTAVGGEVMIIKIFPGLAESVFRSMLSIEGVQGIILETYGSGNAPTHYWFLQALNEVIRKGVFVMNVTQCASGGVDMDIYETGRTLQDIGVINGRDITTEAAVAKMTHLLGQGYSCAHFTKELRHSRRGELSE